ncbi:DUF4179 domain-containing protein [Bacillus sp. DTU_2020_1000418_1_SI_GHA_SEK_038]|uniref:DUF4179 domain-containing protein n=1 Tax=Bacillus sp. DTU_2020_1000418_1_SI_GHA_SEK_038 TaxID=3077585 RepID=UPI0028E81AF0|nr:DUF4179 domain-containing protein [Bacillus sp. DTU_2020_1000418_1_SI_GHA_SEK_038]WNS76079.1 DUF4179 domain-containing protein [Bacillus sp. DTU_2020_1000418_1_SI_GHA_SEK_038]
MFEKEEKELEKSRDFYNEIVFSDDRADSAILEGMKRGKELKIKKRKLRPLKILLTASMIIISFFTTVNVSETMATYMKNIPGMDKVIEFVRYDKGLLAAAENDYIQKVNATVEHAGIHLTIDSVIHDEKGLILFYNYHAENEDLHVVADNFKLLNHKGEELPIQTYGEWWTIDKNSLLELRMVLNEQKQLPKDLIFSAQFSIDRVAQKDVWEIPLHLDESKFVEKKVFDLNETVVIEGQEITIKEVAVYPSQTDVHVSINPQNSKQIFGFNDLRLIDETGEVWGLSVKGNYPINEDEYIIHLQSNYFSNPKKLNLQFSSLRALDKDELWLEIDPVNKKILKSPKDGKFTEIEAWGDIIQLKLETKTDSNVDLIFTHAIDKNGNIIGENEGVSRSPDKDFIIYQIPYPSEIVPPGPIKLKLIDYPATIDKKVNIKIK